MLASDYDLGDGRIRPQRTEDLQRLYDRWRDSMDRDRNFESFLGLDRDGGLLQVPSLRRSPSQRSGRSSSSSSLSPSLAPDDYDFGEHDKRPRRRGPLPRTKREKTAFIRRLGACPSCRTRKVGCNHWDLAEFEEYYQPSRPCDKIYSERLDDLSCLSDGVELLGLEPHSHLTLMSQFEMDFDPATLPRSSPVSPMSPMAPLTPMFFSSQPCIDWAIPTIEDGHFGDTPLIRDKQLIAIGNEVSAGINSIGNWQCRFDSEDVWATRVSAAPCGDRFSTPDEVVHHFFAKHCPIELDNSPIRYKCRRCDQCSTEKQYYCQCGAVGSGNLEQWIYGYAVRCCGQDGAVKHSEPSQGW